MTTEFNIALTHEAVSEALADREVLVWRDRRLTYADLTDRSRRLATYLHRAGLGLRKERGELANHESGQDHVALYLHNGTEYLEGMLAAFKARCVSVNVNFRYVADELEYLFRNAGAKAVIYHARFAPLLEQVRPCLPGLQVLLQVADDSGEDLLPGAVDYETALASAPAELPVCGHSPDDLYILYTGGTTGMPKGVLWRQHDIFMSTMGGRTPGVWDPATSIDDVLGRARAATGSDTMVMVPPFMHGAAQWASFIMMHSGVKIVVPDENRRMDPADVLRTIERERASLITVTGDAVVRPLLDEMRTGKYDLSSLAVIGNGSAVLTPEIKEQVLELLPHAMINDTVGASETGAQGTHLSVKGAVSTGKFGAGPGAVVVNEDMTDLLEPGQEGLGWLGQSGWVPLGYLGDPEKTARTFPVIRGTRYALPGDRARLLPDGQIDLLGRDSVTINSGGEKVFAEEVETAIASHPAVRDVTVCGRPSQRWGNEVVAVVQLEAGQPGDGREAGQAADGRAAGQPADDRTAAGSGIEAALEAHAAQRIARYKLPKAWIFVEAIQRSPSGKADYRWARAQAQEQGHGEVAG